MSANSFSVTWSFYFPFYFNSINVLWQTSERGPTCISFRVFHLPLPTITACTMGAVSARPSRTQDSSPMWLDEGVAGPLRSGVLTCVRTRAGQGGPGAGRLAEVLQQLLQLLQTGLHVLL